MPYKLEKRDGKTCVVKKGSGEVVKCHANPADAAKHLRALYANNASASLSAALVEAGFESSGYKWDGGGGDDYKNLLDRAAIWWSGVVGHNEHLRNLLMSHLATCPECAAAFQSSGWRFDGEGGAPPGGWLDRAAIWYSQLVGHLDHLMNLIAFLGPQSMEGVTAGGWKWGGDPGDGDTETNWLHRAVLYWGGVIGHRDHVVNLVQNFLKQSQPTAQPGMTAHGSDDHSGHGASPAPSAPSGDQSAHDTAPDSNEHLLHMAESFDQMCAEERCPECCRMYAAISRQLRDAASTDQGSPQREQLAKVMTGSLVDENLPGSDRVEFWKNIFLVRDPIWASAAPASPSTTLLAHAEITAPPASHFTNPNLPTLQRFLTITEDGRIFGHLADAGHECHIGYEGTCITAPQESNYSYFTVGTVKTADGTLVPTGPIALKGGHADLTADVAAARAHYDDPTTAKADVVVGTDEHGIWFSGAIRPGTTEEEICQLRASGVSGDWRLIDGDLHLIGICSVNVPGFPKVALAASADGAIQSVVAIGGPPEAKPCDCEDDDSIDIPAAVKHLLAVADLNGLTSNGFKTLDDELFAALDKDLS